MVESNGCCSTWIFQPLHSWASRRAGVVMAGNVLWDMWGKCSTPAVPMSGPWFSRQDGNGNGKWMKLEEQPRASKSWHSWDSSIWTKPICLDYWEYCQSRWLLLASFDCPILECWDCVTRVTITSHITFLSHHHPIIIWFSPSITRYRSFSQLQCWNFLTAVGWQTPPNGMQPQWPGNGSLRRVAICRSSSVDVKSYSPARCSPLKKFSAVEKKWWWWWWWVILSFTTVL